MEKKANNIIFIGQRESKGKAVDAEAPRSITTVGKTYELPESQSKGFYHENAAEIIRLFPKKYKAVKAKGAK